MKKKVIAFYMEAYTRGGAERYLVDLIKSVDTQKYISLLICNQDEVFTPFLNEALSKTAVRVASLKIRSLGNSKILRPINRCKIKIELGDRWRCYA